MSFIVMLSVFGFATVSSATLINVALDGTVSQSSTRLYGTGESFASNAIDGNTGGVWGTDLLTHTESEANAWWQVDLGSSWAIDSIDVWNRTDSSVVNRLFPFTVSILNGTGSTLWSAIYNTLGSTHMVFDPSALIDGQLVKIQLNDTNYLHLAEVQVWADDGNTLSAVPEPSTVLLLGSGLVGLAWYGRKRNKS